MTKLQDRVAKLLRHAESARSIGSIAEAEAFATKAQELMLEHAIEVDVDAYDEPTEDPMGQEYMHPYDIVGKGNWGKRTKWREALARTVANAHFCGLLLHPGSAGLSFYGKKSHRETAAEVFLALLYSMEKTRKAAYRKAKKEGEYMGGFTDSYRAGFTNAIRDKFAETRRKVEHTLKVENNETALTRIDQHRNDLQEYRSEQSWGEAKRLTAYTGYNSSGYAKGYAAGKGSSTAPSKHKRLT